MKTLSLSLLLTLLGLIYYFYPTTEVASSSEEGLAIGFVQSTKGANYLIRKEIKENLLKGMEIYSDDEILIGTDGFSKISLVDNSLVSLGSGSKLKLSSIIENENTFTTFNLFKGKIRGQIKTTHQVTISTPNSTWTTALADFILVHELDESNLAVLSGSLSQKESNIKTTLKNRMKVLSNLASIPEEIAQAEFSYIQGMLLMLTSPNTFIKNQWISSTTQEVKNEYQARKEAVNPEEEKFMNMIRDSRLTKVEKEKAIKNADPDFQPYLIKQLQKNEELAKLKKNIIPALQNEDSFNQLSEEKRSVYLSQYQEYLSEQVSSLTANNQALPLKTEDGRLVYFDDHPHLKDSLPRDSDGNILSVTVDDGFELVGSISYEGANFGSSKIPVINQHGEVEMKSLINEQNLVAAIPIDPHSEFKGININNLESSSAVLTEPKQEFDDPDTFSSKEIQEDRDELRRDELENEDAEIEEDGEVDTSYSQEIAMSE